jgi:hypothetical protein
MRLAIFAMLLMAPLANATVIDFEEFDFVSGSLTLVDSVETKGYTIEPSEGTANLVGLVFPVEGSKIIGTCADPILCGIVLSHSSNPTFSIQNIDYYINAGPTYPGEIISLEFTGYLAGGAELSDTVFWTGADGLITHDFSSEWAGLVAFEANGSGGYDNIVVTSVPIPAALWLFGSALAGLGWMRRKQTL